MTRILFEKQDVACIIQVIQNMYTSSLTKINKKNVLIKEGYYNIDNNLRYELTWAAQQLFTSAIFSLWKLFWELNQERSNI